MLARKIKNNTKARKMCDPEYTDYVYKIYEEVINDVISHSKEDFFADGLDGRDVEILKNRWQTKLVATMAVEEKNEPEQVNGELRSALPELKMCPIKLALPSASGTRDPSRIISINVPEKFLQSIQLKSILTQQILNTTIGLPLHIASGFLQNLLNSAIFKEKQKNSLDGLIDDDQLGNLTRGISQGDGPTDSSDGEKESESDTEENEDDYDAIVQEDDPLNSEDDGSDADGVEEVFDTEHVIVCQFDKITRVRDRWKFRFKDGIMNLKGTDFIFKTASGESKW